MISYLNCHLALGPRKSKTVSFEKHKKEEGNCVLYTGIQALKGKKFP